VIGIEATRGATATQQYAFRWLSKGIKSVPGILENESAMGNDNRVNDSAIDVWHSEGPLGGKVTETGIGYLNRGLFTKVTTTVVTPGSKYKHHFEYDSSVEAKSFSMWDVRPSTTRLFKSMVLDNLELNVEAGESGAWLEASTAVKGWKHADVTAVTPVFEVDETEFTSRHVKVYLAANVAGLADLTASRVKPRSIKLQLEQPKTVEHSIGDGDQPEFDKGTFEAKGEMVIRYKKTDYDDEYFNNAVHAMKIVIENEGDIIEYLATKVRFRELTDSDDKDAVVTQQISFYCESDAANGGHAIVSDVTNGVASYA
jgi:hypothetical protein